MSRGANKLINSNIEDGKGTVYNDTTYVYEDTAYLLVDGDWELVGRLLPEVDGNKSVSCSGYHTVIIKEDGSVWSVGSNGDGQLGDGTIADRYTYVSSGISAISVACGYFHTTIIKEDHSVWSVGYNYHGQLGDGTTIGRSTYVSSNVFAKSIACGGNHTAIIKEDGSVWSVGYNHYGQLGDGTTTDKSSYVSSNINAKSISCNGNHTTMIKDDNSVWTVGSEPNDRPEDDTEVEQYDQACNVNEEYGVLRDDINDITYTINKDGLLFKVEGTSINIPLLELVFGTTWSDSINYMYGGELRLLADEDEDVDIIHIQINHDMDEYFMDPQNNSISELILTTMDKIEDFIHRLEIIIEGYLDTVI